MHRFHSKSAILRFRLAAFFFCATHLLIPLVAGILFYSLIIFDRRLTIISIVLLGLTLIIGFLQWVFCARTRCPLCMTPVLARKGCAKHRKARKFLGSYRLRVAFSILTRNSFLCPYCNESSALELRVPREY